MIRHLALINLCLLAYAIRANGGEFTFYKNLDDNHLNEEIRSGNVEAMHEGRARQSAVFKASLEWVAEHYQVQQPPVGQSCVGTKCKPLYPTGFAIEQQTTQLNERLIRDNAKIELIRWGERKYFDEFITRLSTSDLQIKVETISYLSRINNMAALNSLASLLDSTDVIPRRGHVRTQSISHAAAWAMQDIITSNTGISRPTIGPENMKENFRLYWRRWWSENKKKYGDIQFENGWLQRAP